MSFSSGDDRPYMLNRTIQSWPHLSRDKQWRSNEMIQQDDISLYKLKSYLHTPVRHRLLPGCCSFPYTVIEVLHAVFSYLADRWKLLGPYVIDIFPQYTC